MNNKKLYSCFALLIFLIFFMTVNNDRYDVNAEQSVKIQNNSDYLVQTAPDWAIMKKDIQVKGIYMTGNTASLKSRFDSLVKLVNATELNAVVIDVKDDNGMMTYSSKLPNVIFAGANNNVRIKNIDDVIKTLKANDIYPIARIVTFKDRRAGDKFANLAVKSKNGSIWRDRHGMSWLNPYNKDAWDYIVDIAEEAATKGFREVQFDYVRFPTDGNTSLIDYGSHDGGKTKAEAIADFLAYARQRLGSMGVVVSADVFGLVTTAKDDMGIGQNLEALAQSVDVLCPMVYPSHYGKGSYGVSEPDFEPYKIVNRSISIAEDRIAVLESNNNKARLRPWLQDFTASYLPHYQKYGAAEVRAQINAAYDAGVKEWILWNAANNYTAGALDKK